jgi:hypothetical protein
MTTQCVTYPLKTNTITVMSHVTSLQVIGERISCLQATTETESELAKTVHITFYFKFWAKKMSLVFFPTQNNWVYP